MHLVRAMTAMVIMSEYAIKFLVQATQVQELLDELE